MEPGQGNKRHLGDMRLVRPQQGALVRMRPLFNSGFSACYRFHPLSAEPAPDRIRPVGALPSGARRRACCRGARDPSSRAGHGRPRPPPPGWSRTYAVAGVGCRRHLGPCPVVAEQPSQPLRRQGLAAPGPLAHQEDLWIVRLRPFVEQVAMDRAQGLLVDGRKRSGGVTGGGSEPGAAGGGGACARAVGSGLDNGLPVGYGAVHAGLAGEAGAGGREGRRFGRRGCVHPASRGRWGCRGPAVAGRGAGAPERGAG